MRARIVEDPVDTIDNYFVVTGGSCGHRTDPAFLALAERIAGKEVDLRFIGKDAFEAIDDNYWLPNCCWEAIETAAE